MDQKPRVPQVPPQPLQLEDKTVRVRTIIVQESSAPAVPPDLKKEACLPETENLVITTKKMNAGRLHPPTEKASSPTPPLTPPKKSAGERSHILPSGHWDTATTKEEDYQQLAVYTVNDLDVETEVVNRAEKSLPRNLYLKPSGVNNEFVGVFSTDYIPVGSRFGPVVGDLWHPQEVPANACRKYFWRVSYYFFKL